MSLIYLDCETIPSQHPNARELVRACIKPPGTLKKAESIAAWWAQDADAAVEEQYRRQSLDGGLAGELVSIAVLSDDDDDPGWVRCRAQGESEADLLRDFAREVEQRCPPVTGPDGLSWPPGPPYFVAHNAPFDLGFLWRRAIVCRVPMPFKLPSPDTRAGKDYGDTMARWAGWGGRVSLAALCHALGLASPKDDGMDGGKVYDAWLAGECERIARYNLADAIAVREVWHRLNGIADTASPDPAPSANLEDLPL